MMSRGSSFAAEVVAGPLAYGSGGKDPQVVKRKDAAPAGLSGGAWVYGGVVGLVQQ